MSKKFWSTSEIETGTYTPAQVGQFNVSEHTSYECHYIRVGDKITVTGKFNVTGTDGDTHTVLHIALPIKPSTSMGVSIKGILSSNRNVSGTFGLDISNTRAITSFYPTGNKSESYQFQFTYNLA